MLRLLKDLSCIEMTTRFQRSFKFFAPFACLADKKVVSIYVHSVDKNNLLLHFVFFMAVQSLPDMKYLFRRA